MTEEPQFLDPIIERVAQKLVAWGENLPPEESAVLGILLRRAQLPVPKESEYIAPPDRALAETLTRVMRQYLSGSGFRYEPDGGIWAKQGAPKWVKALDAWEQVEGEQ